MLWISTILIVVGANLEGLTAYSFWVKRMPKDIRALLNGYFNSIARTGQLVVSLSAYTIIKNYSIQSCFLLVAVGDMTVVLCSFFLAKTDVFENDNVEGTKGKESHAGKKQAKAERRAKRDIDRNKVDQVTNAQQVELAIAGNQVADIGEIGGDFGGDVGGDGGGFDGGGGGDGGGFDGGGGGGEG